MKIVVLFGGKSVEHEISIISGFQVVEALKSKYEVFPIYISKSNNFYFNKKVNSIEDFKKYGYKRKDKVKFINKEGDFYFKTRKKYEFDLLFPIVHGKGMEDGSIVSYFRIKGFDIVGNNIAFYSIAQNKQMSKVMLDGLGISNVPYVSISREDRIEKFDYPLILKPNNLGSSIGIKIVKEEKEIESAISEIFKLDDLILAEKYLSDCKEFNISVLNNNGKIETSEIEEVIKEELYTFEDKYLSNGNKKGMNYSRKSNFDIEDNIRTEMETIAKRIYKEFNASGVIRIDFLYKDKLYVNEINSIPGSYAYYLWKNKYDFLELLDISIKESKRYLFFLNKENKFLKQDVIFTDLNKY